MTPEEVRVRLGLRPWFEFAHEVAGRSLDHLPPERRELERWRRTGRTTEMLVRVTAELTENRPARIVGLNAQHARQLVEQVHEFYGRCMYGAYERTLQGYGIGSTPDIILRGFEGWLGIDHIVDEQHPDRAGRLRELWQGPVEIVHVQTPVNRRPAWEVLLNEDPFG